jgi:putative ABC transport system permease protein
LATKVWGESATPATIIGRELQVGTTRARVVGIVPDFHARTLLTPAPLVVFEPYWQTVAGEDGDTRFAIRVRGDAARAIPQLTETIAAVDPRVLVTESMPMRAQIAARFVQIRLGEAVLLTSASLALFLSAMGVYGVVAFLVARRTKEIGILIALGAPRASVTSRFVRHGMQAVAVGTIVGVMLSLAARSLLRAWLVGVAPNDGVSFGVAVAVVIAVSLLASYLPARPASRTDPAVALRDA